MRSFITAALCLALIHSSSARVPHSFRDLVERDAEPQLETQTGILHWISRLFKRIAQTSSTSGTCYEDAYYVFVGHLQPSFCQQYMDTPNITTTVDYTPTTVVQNTFTTYVSTIESLSRYTPLSTLTVTVTSQSSSEAAPQITGRGLSQVDIDEVFRMFRRQNTATTSSANDSSLSSAFSSACSCYAYPGSTVTATYTDEPVTQILSAFQRTTTTVYRTTTAADRVVATTTLTVEPSSTETSSSGASSSESSTAEATGGSSTTTSSSGTPTPTSPPFTCPDDNNTTISQLVGNERFDYLVLCDTVLMDADFYSGALSYSTFGQCVSACSIANVNFDYPVCQGVSYYAVGSSSGNCFLKSTGNLTIAADGVDSAVLQRIAIGITNSSTSGTTTESAPFAGQTITQSPEQMSSAMQSMMSDSSNSMPIVTPPPLVVQSGMMVNAPGAMFSTFVTGGSTFSSGTAHSFSTMYSDGSWYMTYYSSYTEAWATSTTVYEAAATGGYTFSNSTIQQVEQQSDNNGGYTTITTTNYTTPTANGYNVTEVISEEGFNANGTMTSSTATTHYYSYETGGAASGSDIGLPGSSVTGGAGGGNAGGASGSPASGSPITSTSVFSTQTVIINSGGTGGATSTLASGRPTPTPIISATTIVNSFGSAYSTGFAASGGGSGIGSAASGVASGGPSSPLGSMIVSSGGTGGISSFMTSGGPSSAPLSPISVIVSSGGTGGSSGFGASGGPTGTGGIVSSQASGRPSSSTHSLFSNGIDSRSGTLAPATLSTESPPGTAPPSGSLSIPVFNSTGGAYTPPAGTASTSSTPSGTALTSPSGPLPTGPSPYPSVNTTTLSETSPVGTAPSSSSSRHSRGHPTVGPVGTSPLGTAPLSSHSPFSISLDSRTGLYRTHPHPTAPSGYSPPGTGSLSRGTAHSTSHSTSVNTTAPSGTLLSGTASPTRRHSHHGITVAPVSTSPPLSTVPTIPVPPSTCVNMTLGTTTIFSTTTVYGCYSQCPPGTWGGYGGGPHPFGPVAWPTGDGPPIVAGSHGR